MKDLSNVEKMSKTEFAQLMKSDKDTVDLWLKTVRQIKGNDWVKCNKSKGGYHNSEVFFTKELTEELQKVSEAAVLGKGNKGMGVLSRNLPTELNSVPKSELKPQQEAAANDLFIGCVATKGTPAEKRSLARHLDAWADEQELLEQTQQQVRQLECENKQKDSTIVQLTKENGFLKKANELNTAQLELYKKKYHRWYDDYENY